MRISPEEYSSLRLRAHEFLRGVGLYDVTAVDLPGGGSGRTLADLQAIEQAAAPSRIAKALYALRRFFGRVFGWDKEPMALERSLLSRLSEEDRRESEVAPGTADGSFIVLYQFANEALRETINATVHGFIAYVLAPRTGGYRLYWAVYVLPVSWLTRPYLIAIEPFRRVLYPAMFRRIRRAWISRYSRTV